MDQANSTNFTFKNINNALKDVLDWNGLGAELGISYVKIKEIEKNNQRQVAECRRDLIQHWMEKDVSSSWQKLCDALANMGQPVLACRIRETYCSTYSGTQVTSPVVMDTKCDQNVILKISLLKFDWKRVGNRLLGDQSVDDINREEHEEQNKREKMLLKWLQKEGGGATYRRLVEVLEALKYKETAEAVTRLVMEDGGGGIQPLPSRHASKSLSSSPQQPRETQPTPHHSEKCLPSIAAPQIPPTKTEFELKDVFDPIKTLAAEEWKELGKALCIADVESIPSKPGITKSDEAYLREVLRRWLKGPGPSIEDLIRALKDCYCEEAAKELERRFAIEGDNASDQEVASDGGCEEEDAPKVNEAANQSRESIGSTPHLKVTKVKDDCWVVSAGGIAHEAYKMDKCRHGIALIISNITFDQDEDGFPPNRDGGEKDELALQKLFETLGYKVVLLTNLKGAQITKALKIVTGHEQMSVGDLKMPDDKKKLKLLSKEECLVSPENDSFVLCLMSHGEEGVILGVDGDEFKIHDIYGIVGECKNLSNKPKMVFVQACRGDEVPKTDSGDAAREPGDLLFSFATFIGHAAFRGKNGSWYVKDLCSVFTEGYMTKDLLSMLTEVHKAVQNRKDVEDDGTIVKQIPQFTGVLKHKVYFNLKK